MRRPEPGRAGLEPKGKTLKTFERIGDPDEQGLVTSIKQLSSAGPVSDRRYAAWKRNRRSLSELRGLGQADREQNLVASRSMLALVGEPIRAARPIVPAAAYDQCIR